MAAPWAPQMNKEIKLLNACFFRTSSQSPTHVEVSLPRNLVLFLLSVQDHGSFKWGNASQVFLWHHLWLQDVWLL